MSTEQTTVFRTRDSARSEEGSALPFDRREWAQRCAEAEESLRRQYGREARTHDDD